jgi:hypothetical protein
VRSTPEFEVHFEKLRRRVGELGEPFEASAEPVSLEEGRSFRSSVGGLVKPDPHAVGTVPSHNICFEHSKEWLW